eukprot:2842767-Amphidinium_carterae.1
MSQQDLSQPSYWGCAARDRAWVRVPQVTDWPQVRPICLQLSLDLKDSIYFIHTVEVDWPQQENDGTS